MSKSGTYFYYKLVSDTGEFMAVCKEASGLGIDAWNRNGETARLKLGSETRWDDISKAEFETYIEFGIEEIKL